MNKIIITTCVLCMLCVSCRESAQVNYIIKGSVNGMNGEKVFLLNEENDRAIIDSTTISNNFFRFKGTQSKPCVAILLVNKISSVVILENGTINVSFDNSPQITGTPTNNIFSVCYKKINAIDDKYTTLLKQRIELLKENQKDEIDILEKELNELYNKKVAVIKECINQNLNNIVGAYLLYYYSTSLSNEEIDQILTNASTNMKSSIFVKSFIELQKNWKNTEIGQKFTDFKMKDPNDKEISLSDYIGKGKYVLLDFWASWCGSCRREMPYLKVAYEKFKSKGFEIVGVSLDIEKEAWLKAIKDLGITWPQMSDLKGGDKPEGAKIYGIRYIPFTLLVDPNGIIIAKSLSGDKLEKKLNEIFK